ncbi:SsrA-binding protein [Candidatus Falkowbacteria bacterium CG10_big_fil_rev_8_21_14_0_10_43_10]|uniref:SsrA-binding protein n=1 Tax=Candidatus Falkowbacteria bacterium CG10_big_fil_rev_8_21_14_0_10_43_10 TaxID=1974567 RepID=A0A2H0V4G4_9BACT|nr:MAG: SsrA-binding protein [Candidatus Falkowbacteria bacterium CG10_big_fil_rev_8_21_14_0_10_43_10]
MPTYAINKRANFDYQISDKYEAGIVFAGYEVKSVKTGHISLKEAFVTLKRKAGHGLPDAYLTNCHIPLYKHAGKMPDYEPARSRKLLIKKIEIRQLIGKTKEKGLTLVPIRVYNKGSLIKLEFGVGKGKKKIDKRENIKKRETERRIQKLQKQY